MAQERNNSGIEPAPSFLIQDTPPVGRLSRTRRTAENVRIDVGDPAFLAVLPLRGEGIILARTDETRFEILVIGAVKIPAYPIVYLRLHGRAAQIGCVVHSDTGRFAFGTGCDRQRQGVIA